MLKKRLIFTLLYEDDYFILSRNFNRQKIGSYRWLQDNYNFSNISWHIDEMILLNISNTRDKKNKKNFIKILNKISKNCFMPISVGGGIDNEDDAKAILESGADKIVINSNSLKRNFIERLAFKFGRQCIVVSVDYKKNEFNSYDILTNNGKKKINLDISEYFNLLKRKPIGELLLNSIDRDGTGFGFDFEILKLVKNFNIPIIFQGGVGNAKHLLEGFKNKYIDAAATANLLNFIGNGIKNARDIISNNNINLPQR
jgi:cyclase